MRCRYIALGKPVLAICGLILFIQGSPAFGQNSVEIQPVSGIEERTADISNETALLIKAKESLFKLDWENARRGLETYLREYPDGKYADEALYWLAQCLNRVSKQETEAGGVIALKEEVVRRISDLVGRFGQGPWSKEARELRAEISKDLEGFGLTQYNSYLDPAVVAERESYRGPRIMQTLKELTPTAAFTIAQSICLSDRMPDVRVWAAYFLGDAYRQDALPLLETVGKQDPDANVREEVNSIVQRIHMSLIPVRLRVAALTSSLPDNSEFERIRENTINMFAFPNRDAGDAKIEDTIRSFFKNQAGSIKLFVSGFARQTDYIGKYSGGGFGFGGSFLWEYVNPDLIKEANRINGKIRVTDRLTQQKYEKAFSISAREGNLVVMRRGQDLAMMVFRFESQAESQSGVSLGVSPAPEPPAASRMRTEVLGCSLRSFAFIAPLRNSMSGSWDPSSEIVDYGPAEVGIPGLGGTWILAGQILCDFKARSFIGRQFTLTDPQGKIVASGARIEVPAASPQAYRTEGKSTAIVFAPELKSLKERMIFEAGKFHDFEVGPALADALASAVMNVDRTASLRDADPASGEFNRVFKFSIDRSKSGLGRLGEEVGGSGKYDVGGEEFGDLSASRNRQKSQQRYTLTVKVEILDGRTMKPMRSEMIEGRGAYNRVWSTTFAAGSASPLTGGGAEFEAKKLQKACDDAIGQVLKSFSKLLKDLR